MYLKRLEIKGFKSFSQKTILDFLPFVNGRNSVTAVVGPNGSGKSNIADAIRWVMGEQSLKNLRGKKSEDIIFGGSEIKGQLSAAEVIMTLDNSGGILMKDHSEIIITRRMYRSGEGEYLINGSPVRLLDIHLLLAKAQFAQHSYSVVGQGMIDRMLTISESERKDLLDEASGIKEFKIRQHQARLKLNRTNENIAQAQRLMEEVEPRLRMLSRQVRKLQKRQDIELQLRENQEQYYCSIYLHGQKELDSLQADMGKIEIDYQTSFRELKAIQEELAGLARASTRQQVFEKLQSDYQSVVREKNELERLFAVRQGQAQAEYSKEGKQGIAWLEKKITELNGKQEQMNSQLMDLHAEERTAEDLLLKQKRLVEDLIAKKTDLQIKISQLEKQIFEGQSEQDYRQFSGLLAVQAILENGDRFGRIHGMLAELGEVKEDYCLALEVVAGSYLSALVVEDENTARLAIEFLRKNRLGTATFLPLNKIFSYSGLPNREDILNQSGVVGLASNLIKFSSKFANAFSFVFGRTIVIEDLKVAREIGIGKVRMVSLSGDLVEKSGVMKGGYRHKRNNGLGFSQKIHLSRHNVGEYQSQVRFCKQELEQVESQLEQARNEILKQQANQNSLSAKADMIDGEQTKLIKEIAVLEQDLRLSGADPKEYGAILSKLSQEKNDLKKQISLRDQQIQELAIKIEGYNEEEEKKKQRVFALQEAMQSKQNQVNDSMSQRNEVRVQIARIETKQDNTVEEARSEMSTSIESMIERGSNIVDLEQANQLLDKIQKLKYQLSLIGGIDQEVMEDYEQTKEKYEFLSTQINDLNGAIDDLEKMVVELDDIMRKKRSMAFKKIRTEFSRYIKILFDGGSGVMKEIYGEPKIEESEGTEEGEDFIIEETAINKKEKILLGIDIDINPPGKKIKHISALSGGERTLASIALICAILSYNPSPFVVLDEVEAALDEANTRRFAKIITELSTRSQFIIITHNRVTMHSADVLYGVTMSGDGVSKLLSVKLEDQVLPD
ncbi:MAG: AAA family ATPase [bacterium]